MSKRFSRTRKGGVARRPTLTYPEVSDEQWARLASLAETAPHDVAAWSPDDTAAAERVVSNVLGRSVGHALILKMVERLGPRLAIAANAIAADSCRGEALEYERNDCEEATVVETEDFGFCVPSCLAEDICSAHQERASGTSAGDESATDPQ